jgi:hypothetical protein
MRSEISTSLTIDVSAKVSYDRSVKLMVHVIVENLKATKARTVIRLQGWSSAVLLAK